MKEPQMLNIFFAFITGLIIIYIFAIAVGKENKGRWFKKRDQMSFFNRRGMLGETWHFGYPRTWQGVLIMVAMYSLIFALGYAIVFVY